MRRTKMRRFQIYLEPDTDAHLRRLATKMGRPKAELVREGINLFLEREAARMDDSLLELVGIGGEAGCPDAAERHDDYLYDGKGGRGGKSKRR